MLFWKLTMNYVSEFGTYVTLLYSIFHTPHYIPVIFILFQIFFVHAKSWIKTQYGRYGF